MFAVVSQFKLVFGWGLKKVGNGYQRRGCFLGLRCRRRFSVFKPIGSTLQHSFSNNHANLQRYLVERKRKYCCMVCTVIDVWRLQVSLDVEMLAVCTARTAVIQIPRSAVERIRAPIRRSTWRVFRSTTFYCCQRYVRYDVTHTPSDCSVLHLTLAI